MFILSKVAIIFFCSLLGHAGDSPLNKATGPLITPIDDTFSEKLYLADTKDLSKSDVWSVLKDQTVVKSQGPRNLCTVFSISALLESLVAKEFHLKTMDFSEEWLQYLVALRSPSGGGNGSTVADNFRDIKKSGLATENSLPYDKRLWTVDSPDLAVQRCANLTALSLKRCLSSHTSPLLMNMSDANLVATNNSYFIKVREDAQESLDYLKGITGGTVRSVSKIKELLRNGTPLTLEVDFYFGSWNHSGGSSLGIDIDAGLFKKGIVTYPDDGSADRTLSVKERDRHSVVIVGYDDSKLVTYSRLMNDGTTKTITRKGVYYFKNSWGTEKFGRSFTIDNKTIRGFGMITQDYANSFGQFFYIQLNAPKSI